jgi:uncharacterized repeat protein (TIGR03803 family)
VRQDSKAQRLSPTLLRLRGALLMRVAFVAFLLTSICKAGAQSYSILYSFRCGPDDGSQPSSGLVSDAAGNLYGVTAVGGSYGNGAVFKLSLRGTESLAHSFAGAPSDGAGPFYTNLAQDLDGNLYGTTSGGGTEDLGVAYKLTPAGVETVLHNFGVVQNDGYLPYAGLLLYANGALYGTAYDGGDDYGTVFEILPSGIEHNLYRFLGGKEGDSQNPVGNLIRNGSGSFYGTALGGGQYGGGTAFTVSAEGKETILHNFGSATDGASPYDGLTRDSTGNLFGTTAYGGESGNGAVFEISEAGQESVLYSFTGSPDGANPVASVVQDKAGNLYGTTFAGGSMLCKLGFTQRGCGILFKVTQTGVESILHHFAGAPDGANPEGVLLLSSGTLYGTTTSGGAYGCGTVFEYTP